MTCPVSILCCLGCPIGGLPGGGVDIAGPGAGVMALSGYRQFGHITLLGFFVTGIEGTWSRGTIDLDSMDNYKLVSQLIISLLLVMNGTFQFIITKATLQKCRCGI